MALAAFAALFGGGSDSARSANQSLTTPSFNVSYRDVDDAEAKIFVDAAETARIAVTKYLDRGYDDRISISISNDHKFPDIDPKTGRIVIPASRIRGDAGGPPGLKGRGPAFIQVLTVVIAPSRNRKLGRLLETGLGAYLQEKFGDKSKLAYPSMGRDLHRETSLMAANFGRFIALVDAERERNITTRLIRIRRLAHLEEGSFVRYLIESEGITEFLKFYDGAPIEEVYAADLQTLERSWQRLIRSLNPEAIPRNNVN
ncbi:MAG: hypothetical protein O7G83_00665 [Proteobacteria bacterium]|nr:hypothetical protein [Pseudomonadota bacterium]